MFAQVVIKLLMDPMYGGTIHKPVETDTIIKHSRDEFETCIPLICDYIGSVLGVNGRYCSKQVISVMSHFNYVHCGVEI